MKLLLDDGTEIADIEAVNLKENQVWVIHGEKLEVQTLTKLSRSFENAKKNQPDLIVPHLIMMPNDAQITMHNMKDLVIKFGNIIKLCEEAGKKALLTKEVFNETESKTNHSVSGNELTGSDKVDG